MKLKTYDIVRYSLRIAVAIALVLFVNEIINKGAEFGMYPRSIMGPLVKPGPDNR